MQFFIKMHVPIKKTVCFKSEAKPHIARLKAPK